MRTDDLLPSHRYSRLHRLQFYCHFLEIRVNFESLIYFILKSEIYECALILVNE